MTKSCLIFCFCCLVNTLSQSNKITIQGKVTDVNGNPIYQANVYVQESYSGITTNRKGEYRFVTDTADRITLVCKYLGYKEFNETYVSPGDIINADIVLKETSVELSEVQINASSFTSGDEKGVTLSSLDIVTTPGAAADIMLALKTFPGVAQIDDGAGLYVRGGDFSETIVVIDGAYIYHPYRYESPIGGYFGIISPSLIKGTYFSSGGFGVEYGNSMSGALIMESLDIPSKSNFEFGVGLAGYSSMIRFPLAGNDFGINLSGSYSNSRTMFLLNKKNLEFSKYPLSYDGNLNTIFKYSKDGSLKLFVFHTADNLGVAVEKPDQKDFFTGNSKTSLYNLSWKHFINSNLFLSGNAAFTKFNKNEKLASLNLDTGEELLQSRLSGIFILNDNLSMTAGFEYFRLLETLKGEIPQTDYDLDPNALTYTYSNNYLSHRFSLFDKIEYKLSNSAKFTAGLRYEHESLSKENFIDFRTSLNWRFSDNWDFIAAIGTYNKPQYGSYLDNKYGNPNLKPSRAIHYIAGINFQDDRTNFRIEFYYKDYKNLLLNDSVTNFSNDGYGFARGVDVFYKGDWGLFSGWFSASYVKSERKWNDIPVIAPADFDITLNFVAILKFDLSYDWYINGKFQYATGKPYSNSPTSYNSERVPSYQKFDLSINKLFSFFEDNLTVFYLAISNLFNRKNIFDYHFSADYSKKIDETPAMLRSYYFGANFSFN